MQPPKWGGCIFCVLARVPFWHTEGRGYEMTNLQKIALRLSETRGRLNEISGLEGDAFTDEIRNEATALQAEYGDLEVRHRSAIVAEGEDESRMRGAFNEGDGENAEIRQLMGAVSLGDYLTPASAGSGIEGRARELNAALKVDAVGKSGGVAIPWAVLAGPTPAPEARQAEQRAFTATNQAAGAYGGGIMARPILQRLFGPGILDALGCRIDSVPAGRTEWPLITGGVAPDQAVEGAAAAAAGASEFTLEGGRATYSAARIRALTLGPTDASAGWTPLRFRRGRDDDMPAGAAGERRRARVWL